MKNKTSYKLIVLIFIISAIITSLFTYLHINEQYKDRVLRFEKSLENIEQNQLPLLSESLWKVDYETANIFLNNLINSEKIIYAELIEYDKVINKVGVFKESNVIKKEFDINKKTDEKIYNIGKLVILADLTPVYEDMEKSVKGILFTELIKMFLLAVLIIYIMKKLLTNPLEKVANYANRLSLKNLEHPLEVRQKDKDRYTEFDVVTDSINTMRVNLIEQIKENEEKNYILSQQSKQALMGEMIGCIAHQWRQPLSLISVSNGLLKLSHENESFCTKEEKEKAMDNIDSSVQHLSDTIDDFRNFFKPDKARKYFNISKTFDKVFTLLNTQFINNNINIIKEVEDIEIYGFENELIQVLINILNNARDELKTKKDQKRLVFISVFKKDKMININIKDNAGGVPKEFKDKVFEQYFTTKDDKEGTGLGLYMSKEIIDNHMNGRLSVENVKFSHEEIKYKGAQFKIEFSINEK